MCRYNVVIQVSGQTYLNTFGLDPKWAGRDAAALGAIVACLGLLSYLTLALGSWSGCGFRRSGAVGHNTK